ncbi:MAG: hypothetical protein EA371_02845 [Gammaproteobacteria bacterium]|nr:MAG: hypothetical protein EA371_02845 [Gammaproteobacteria bacterium]
MLPEASTNRRSPGTWARIALACLLAPMLSAQAQPAIVLDGEFGDWPAGQQVLADPWHLYLRLALPEAVSLQTSTTTTEVLIDLDDEPATGRQVTPADGAAALGVDLALLFAPAESRDDAGLGSGAAARAYRRDGTPRRLRHQQVGFAALPTHLADEFELRIPRHVLEDRRLGPLLRAEGTARVLVRRLAASGRVVWESGVMTLSRPAAAAGPWQVDSGLPARPAEAVRVLSANVEWASPLENPAPFARLLAAAQPDIVLLQEWDRIERDARGRPPPRLSARSIAEWFDTHAPAERPWEVHRTGALGVAIASQLPLTAVGEAPLAYRLAAGEEALLARSVRYVAALAESRIGPLLLANIHLKCCGGAASAEDLQRKAEAVSINLALRRALAETDAEVVLVGGDFNLVGVTAPREIIAAGLDPTGGNLVAARILTLAGDSATTWRDPRSRFPPSRLDYLLYPPSVTVAVNAFLFDTAGLGEGALRRHGLAAGDAAYSDHLPLVVDLERRQR